MDKKQIFKIILSAIISSTVWFCLSKCFAMTSEDIVYYQNQTVDAWENLDNSNLTDAIEELKNYDIVSKLNNANLDFSVFDQIVFIPNSSSFTMYLYNSNEIKMGFVNNRLYWLNVGQSYNCILFTSIQNPILGTRGNSQSTADNNSTTAIRNLYCFTSNGEIYSDYQGNIISTDYILLPEPLSVELISTSGKKFTFTDKNQCNVFLSGNYNINQFRFYVQRYIDNAWYNFSNSNEFYILNNYRNPYYITFQNLNYYPIGTYRYLAVDEFGNSFYSNSFEITGNSVIVNGNASGTIDGDGNVNIDIEIDNGNIIDDIKDYLGGSPNVSEEEFENSFPNVDIEDPSEDFFTWIFENIEQIFLSTEEQEFEFSLYTDNSYVVSTEQIKVPDSAIKSLVGLSIDFGICYWILKDVRKTINKVKEGNIEALATEDITANMV